MKMNEKGLTMIEVIASVIIITIVLLSIAQLIIRSNITATYNNEKLVAIDLAESILEHLRLENHVVKQTIDQTTETDINPIEIPLKDIGLTAKDTIDKTIYITEMNNQTYQVEAFVLPSNDEHKKVGMYLIVVKVYRVELSTNENLVTVKTLAGNSKIEGFVKI